MGETNSFEKPKSYAEGVPFVVVNGVVVIDKGQHTGAKPGKALARPRIQGGDNHNTLAVR